MIWQDAKILLQFQWKTSQHLIKCWTGQASEDIKIINVPWLIQSQEVSATDYPLLQLSVKDEILLKERQHLFQQIQGVTSWANFILPNFRCQHERNTHFKGAIHLSSFKCMPKMRLYEMKSTLKGHFSLTATKGVLGNLLRHMGLYGRHLYLIR